MTRPRFVRPNRCLHGVPPALVAMVLLLTFGNDSLRAQRPYPPEMAGTTSEVYRAVGDVELRMYFCNPEDHTADDRRPAIVFFFGGGWRAGSPQQFLPHCRYLAERGMVATIADYRVASRHGVTADECVKDAKSAVRWLRANADRLGIDPDRIAAGGGSAGGHLAAATATLPGHDPDPDGVSPVPNALVLFNPATVLAPVDGDPIPTEEERERFAALTERFGAAPESMSPYHHLREDLPPTIMFHGTADETVPHGTAERFCLGLREYRARCDFVSYHDQGHGFFNFGRGEGEEKNKWYDDTVSRMDGFLYSLEWLDPKPNPDGTPGERLTWRESLSRALGNQRLPAAVNEIKEQLEAEARAAAASEDTTGGEEDDAPPESGQADPDGAR
ncbi:MAG: alpha/beta hydrolase [Holophagales bacterium]|nr:alpha/beta hydrolase [Holophagales bacterium]MYC09647.1 alpha/beta hydrolase [Holophagales bacterium]